VLVLVVPEEYALLFGAPPQLAVLSAIMIGTRRLDWYDVARTHGGAP
jgi:inner membrane protein involved in colicin E2 resistance